MKFLRVWAELLGLCARYRPRLTALVVILQLVGTISFVAIGLSLKFVVDAADDGDHSTVVVAALVAAAASVGTWLVGDLAFSLRIHLVEQVGLTRLEPEILRTLTELDEIDHLERPDFLDRITTLRGKTWAIVDSAWAVVDAGFLVLRLVIVLLLLGSVSGWLLLLLPCVAVQLLFERHGRKAIRAAYLASGEDDRLQQHLFEVCTGATSSKEVRVAGARPALVRLQLEATQRRDARRQRAQSLRAGLATSGWLVFVAGFTGCLALVAHDARQPGGSLGDVVLALTVGTQLRMIVEFAVRRSTDAAGATRILDPFLWLREFAEQRRLARDVDGAAVSPSSGTGGLTDGIVLHEVSFTYPGADRPALDDVSVRLPAGAVVAVVGEYGSGKSTLVKLLTKMYAPDSGRITVDGVDLSSIDTAAWRTQLSAAFQDFGRYQTTFSAAVGLGAPDLMDGAHRRPGNGAGDGSGDGSDDGFDPTEFETALAQAVADADASLLRDRLPDGSQTELGLTFGGVELSEGQWQRVALARACMRTAPLLFVLDEPTASLDAPSEHAIFERYSVRARDIGARIGAITVIVSHRFSTVADADLILVMEQGRLVESGSHQALLALDGTYASLFGIQAAAYAPG